MTNLTIDQEMQNFKHAKETVEINAEEQQILAASALLNTTSEQEAKNQMLRMMGQIETVRTISDLTNVMGLSKLAEIKKNRLYKALKGVVAYDKTGALIPNVSTWEGFCKSIGYSYQKIDLDIANLELFGEETLERLNALGIGYRNIRKLRKLPDDDLQAIVNGETVKVGDKEEIISLIEDMSLKHSRIKKELENKVHRLESDKEIDERLQADKDKKINQLEKELQRDFTPDEAKERKEVRNEELRKELFMRTSACLTEVRLLSSFIDEAFEFEGMSKTLEEALYGDLRGVFKEVMEVGLDHQIYPEQLLGGSLSAITQDS